MTSLARLPLLPAAVVALALAILLPPGPAWALLVPAAGLLALAQASVPAWLPWGAAASLKYCRTCHPKRLIKPPKKSPAKTARLLIPQRSRLWAVP